MSSRRAALAVGVIAAVTARTAYEGLRRTPISGDSAVRRKNFRGTSVELLGGAAAVAGAAGSLALARGPRALRIGALVAVLGAGLCGGLDDVAGDGDVRGLRGHLGAAAAGRPTTGGLKIVGIGVSGLVAGALVTDGGVATAVPAGLAVAAAANVANLFDLRPGRAAKVVLLTGVPLMAGGGPGGRTAGAAVGAAIGVLGPDLGERTMLGDAGANALGALLGVAAVTGASRRRCCLVLSGLLALTVASEAVSFSAVIDRTPVLRFADRLGRSADA